MKFVLVFILLGCSISASKAFDEKVCDLEKLVGNCKGLLPRYYYNKLTKICESFNYGGCNGNKNNFLTFQECQDICSPVTKDIETDPCKLPKAKGMCMAAFARYFYSQETNTCEEFYYGGCQGNANRFETKDECIKMCQK